VPAAPRWAADSRRGGGGSSSSDPPPQLAASRAAASEGLSGLVPRARVLATLGLGLGLSPAFWGLAAVSLSLFAALALGYGDAFIHGGRPAVTGPPPYIDPYSLLDEAPREGPYVGFRE